MEKFRSYVEALNKQFMEWVQASGRLAAKKMAMRWLLLLLLLLWLLGAGNSA